MGFGDGFKVFGDSALPFKENDFKNKYIGIDASVLTYEICLGHASMRGLTDKHGNSTVPHNTLVNINSKYHKLGVKGLIYVFDNPKPNPMKIKEQKKRRATMKRAEQKLAECPREDVDRLEKRTFKITDALIQEIKRVLNLMGIAWVVTPEGYEAEHLGATLCKQRVIDVFVTSDSDALLFGATSIVRRVRSKSKKKIYEQYLIDNVLTDYELTQEQLVHLGVILGTDFADKTRGIGAKTVLTRGLTVILTDEQKKAKKYFLSDCPFTPDMIHKENANKEVLIEWLVSEKNFNRERLTKVLAGF